MGMVSLLLYHMEAGCFEKLPLFNKPSNMSLIMKGQSRSRLLACHLMLLMSPLANAAEMSNMDHGSMDMSGMDMSDMDHSGMDMSDMDMSDMDMSVWIIVAWTCQVWITVVWTCQVWIIAV